MCSFKILTWREKKQKRGGNELPAGGQGEQTQPRNKREVKPWEQKRRWLADGKFVLKQLTLLTLQTGIWFLCVVLFHGSIWEGVLMHCVYDGSRSGLTNMFHITSVVQIPPLGNCAKRKCRSTEGICSGVRAPPQGATLVMCRQIRTRRYAREWKRGGETTEHLFGVSQHSCKSPQNNMKSLHLQAMEERTCQFTRRVAFRLEMDLVKLLNVCSTTDPYFFILLKKDLVFLTLLHKWVNSPEKSDQINYENSSMNTRNKQKVHMLSIVIGKVRGPDLKLTL